MSRRFLTVEDLSRAEGGEVIVDADTVVTPQALEAAAAAGITIRTPNGPYSEPSPDRGPDAARAARSLPHLPEPVDEQEVGVGFYRQQQFIHLDHRTDYPATAWTQKSFNALNTYKPGWSRKSRRDELVVALAETHN